MKNLLLFCFVLASILGFSQTDKEIEQISESTCSCLQSKDLSNVTVDEMQMQLGICMISSANKVGVEFDLGDQRAIEELGERVGFELALNCPDFIEMMGQMMEEDPELLNDILEDDDEDFTFSTKSSNGLVLEITSAEFVSLKINSDTGRKETYYWMKHFDGAHLLENNGEAIRNKKIIVTYQMMECYSPKLEDYIEIRVLRSLELAE